MNREIKLLFDQYNINIPFNQLVLNYREPEESEKTVLTSSEIETARAFLEHQKELSKNIDDQQE